MISSVYKQRYKRNGKTIVARTYRGRYRLDGDIDITDIPLKTTDKQVAEKKLKAIIQEKEHERAGIIAPRLMRESASQPLTDQLKEFLADLKIKGRSAKYLSQMDQRNTRIIEECAWRLPKDIDSNGFIQWRAIQSELAPKTLNDYLNAACAFYNWLVTQGRIGCNPLALVEEVDVRGKQQKRRALTDDELQKLLLVAGPRRLLYLTAAYTGLRQNELRQLVWADVDFDAPRPYITARLSTTKNKKDAVIPLHPELAHELQRVKPDVSGNGEAVFFVGVHPERAIRKHFQQAGIPIVDAIGRKVDFHALRNTFSTMLARSGVSQRLAQELMRHSDPNLTAKVYTDASQLPTFAAVDQLPWVGGKACKVSRPTSELSSQIASQTLDFCRPFQSQPDNFNDETEISEAVDSQQIDAKSPALSGDGNWSGW